jgi:hypothetical protein
MLKNFTGSGITSCTASGAVEIPIAVRLLGVMLLWMLAPALTQATMTDNEVSFHAQPRICVMPAGEQTCSIQLLITWTSVTSRNVCLHFHGHSEHLHCWEAQQAGSFSMALAQTDNIHVQLLDAQTLDVLSTIEIPVIKRDVRDTRRRRRHAWSVF